MYWHHVRENSSSPLNFFSHFIFFRFLIKKLSVHYIYYQFIAFTNQFIAFTNQFIAFTISSLQFTTGPQKFWLVSIENYFLLLLSTPTMPTPNISPKELSYVWCHKCHMAIAICTDILFICLCLSFYLSYYYLGDFRFP